jgi:hypothetical protein
MGGTFIGMGLGSLPDDAFSDRSLVTSDDWAVPRSGSDSRSFRGGSEGPMAISPKGAMGPPGLRLAPTALDGRLAVLASRKARLGSAWSGSASAHT